MAADTTVSFAVNVDSNAPQVGEDAAAALERMQRALEGDMAALKGMQGALRNMKGEAGVSNDTVKRLKDTITATKSRIALSQEGVIKLGGSFARAKPQVAGIKGGFADLLSAAGKVPGPLGNISGKMGAIGKLVAGGIVAAGVAAIATALLALAAASIAAAGALALYGIKQADARRTELLRLEGLTKIRYFMGGFAIGQQRAADSAAFLQGAIDKVSDSLPIARDEVAKYTDQLYKMGLRGGNLQAALEGTATTAAVQGDEQAQRFAHWAAGAALVGQSVRRLADDVKARLGGIAEKRMLSLDIQTMKLKSHFATLFRDVKIEGFLRLVKQAVDMFSQGEATGRALKAMIEAVFGSFSGEGEAAGKIVKRFFQGVTLAAQALVIMWLEARIKLRDLLGKDFFKNIDAGKLALYAGMAAVSLVVGAFAALAVAAGIAAVAVALVAAPFVIAGYAIFKLVGYVREAIALLRQLPDACKAAGKAVADGLSEGIASGRSGIIAQMTGLAGAAVKAFKTKLGIASPSRVMFAAGVHVGAGAEGGIKASVPKVRAASKQLADAPRMANVASLMPRITERERERAAPAPIMATPAPARDDAAGGARGSAPAALPSIIVHVHVDGSNASKEEIAQATGDAIEQKLRAWAIALGAAKAA